jgi:hypothetical protein
MKYHEGVAFMADARKAFMINNRKDPVAIDLIRGFTDKDTERAMKIADWYDTAHAFPTHMVSMFYQENYGFRHVNNLNGMTDFINFAGWFRERFPFMTNGGKGMAYRIINSYYHLCIETEAQFVMLRDVFRVRFEFFHGEGEPYKTSLEMIEDLRKNRHLYILPTRNGYGNENDTATQNFMLTPVREDHMIGGEWTCYNDLFRGVHDAFGHAVYGNGFGGVGEEVAYRCHGSMYSLVAIPAMTAETRGQNNWFNFGPWMRDTEGKLLQPGQEGYLKPCDRPFAEQKNVIAPLWAMEV